MTVRQSKKPRRLPERRPATATLISVVALVAALGGTSYAALQVGSNQIRDASVRSADLRDRGVKAVDIGNGEIGSQHAADNSLTGDDIAEVTLGTIPFASEAGSAAQATEATHAQSADHATSAGDATHALSADQATNATNAANATHAATATHATTAGAANSAFSTYLAADVSLSNAAGQQPVLSLPVPEPGSYVIWAQATLNNNDATAISVACVLSAGGDSQTQSEGLPGQAGGTQDFGSVALTAVHNFAAPGMAELTCNNPGGDAGDVFVSHRRITAVEVGSLTNSLAPGP